MSGGKAEARSKSDNTVVRTGGSGFGGDMDCGLEGGSDGMGGRDGRDRKCDRRLIK